MPPSLLSDAARVSLDRPAAARADLRTDAMLLTHGRAGTEPAIAAALLIDAVRSGHLDVLEPPHLVPTPTSPAPHLRVPADATSSPAPHGRADATSSPAPHGRADATSSPAPHGRADATSSPAPHGRADATSSPAPHGRADATSSPAPHGRADATSSPAPHGRADATSSPAPHGRADATSSPAPHGRADATSSPAPHPPSNRHVGADATASPAPHHASDWHLAAASHRPRELRVVAGRSSADEPLLLADLRARVLTAPTGSPLRWIERTAEFAPHRIATELVTAGIAMPLSPRFARTFTLSVNARAEAAARARIITDPALAVLLYTCGLPTGDPLPPSAHSLPPAERAILAALRDYARTTTLTTADFPAA